MTRSAALPGAILPRRLMPCSRLSRPLSRTHSPIRLVGYPASHKLSTCAPPSDTPISVRGSPSNSGATSNNYECVLKLEIVFDRQIEERVEGVPPAFARDVRDGAAFERLHRRANHFLHGEQVPLAVEDARVLQVFAKGGAEGGIHVVTLLHLDGLIEDPAP